MFATPISPRERLFISLFISASEESGTCGHSDSGLIGEDEEINLLPLPPVERDSARAGCVTRDVSKSYRCRGW